MSEEKHTKLPWSVCTNPTGQSQPASPYIIDGSGLPDGGDIIAIAMGNSETVKENVRFIVRACNSHYELLEALKVLKHVAVWDDVNSTEEEVMSAIRVAREVIAKATKGYQ